MAACSDEVQGGYTVGEQDNAIRLSAGVQSGKRHGMTRRERIGFALEPVVEIRMPAAPPLPGTMLSRRARRCASTLKANGQAKHLS